MVEYHAGTERVEHIQIIINPMQEADNVIPTLEQLLSTTRVGLIKTARNVGIYLPCVFHVRSGPNQSYSPEYDWERLSPYSTRKVKVRTLD